MTYRLARDRCANEFDRPCRRAWVVITNQQFEALVVNRGTAPGKLEAERVEL
ncbi:hypothetical protein GGQ76_001869 [Aureimonas jatrophae]|uniref:Uncharacterized protein n=2 Tax=Aureimonas TaxID=414371 RepID=A0A1H0HG55_9HYPH|nr:hypothetical protein [Aureimonas phyllosphaerae]MBB3950575.1 hypothetical protein [Aureimonas jatrophae]MBB3958170.1 hypothetical protein [Aureimonas phyllosphaerae]SDO18142.1 hypothetical protein SAMN05192530_10483 [Aureimonas jatrophae]SFE92914.1 hypothetical protein SAMN05216566_101140 [Aureimonas phyllosphaerae]